MNIGFEVFSRTAKSVLQVLSNNTLALENNWSRCLERHKALSVEELKWCYYKVVQHKGLELYS